MTDRTQELRNFVADCNLYLGRKTKRVNVGLVTRALKLLPKKYQTYYNKKRKTWTYTQAVRYWRNMAYRELSELLHASVIAEYGRSTT